MDNKNIFDNSGSSKKIIYYIIAALCIAAILIIAFISYNAMKNEDDVLPEVTDPVDDVTDENTDDTNDNTNGNTNDNTDNTDDSVTQPTVADTEVTEQTDSQQTESAETDSKTTATAEPQTYIMPVDGTISVSFSLETPVYSQTLGDWRMHDGIDISAAIGTDVVAANYGVVEEIKRDDLFGVTVVVKHTDGKKTTYSNLEDSVELEEGQIIEQNAIIGKVGETAIYEIADGPHLHFEMSENGKKIDPTEILQK